MSEVILQIASTRHRGWKAVGIRRSLETAASQFELDLTDRWSDHIVKPIKAGSACTISIGTERVITGYIDEVTPSYNADQRRLHVRGRSKIADLVDCSNTTQTFNNRTLPDVARALAKPFGIAVIDQAGITTKRQNKAIDEGQTFFEFLEEWARSEGVRLVDDVDGNLVITRAGTTRVKTPLNLGENILSADGSFNTRERFSQYIIQAQQSWGPNTTGAAATQIQGIAADINLRFRPILIHSEAGTDAGATKQRALAERNVQYGRSKQITYTVFGWHHAAGGLWQPNTLVRIDDDYMAVHDWWIIGEVEYTLDNQGELTRLTVSPKEAYDIIPLPADDSGGGGWQ